MGAMNSERSSPDRAGTNWIFPFRRIGASIENSSKIVRIAYGGTKIPGSPPETTAPLLRSCTLRILSSVVPPSDSDPGDPWTGEEIRDRGLGHGAVAADDQHVHGPPLSHGNDSVISPFRNGSGVGHPRRPEDRGTGEDEDDAACERGSVPEEAREGAAEEGAEDRSESLDRVEGTEGAGPSAFRGQAGDQCGAGDIDHGPARAHPRVEGDDEREARDGRESGETQQEEGSEKQGPSDGPV